MILPHNMVIDLQACARSGKNNRRDTDVAYLRRSRQPHSSNVYS